jgi:hypothetical protein
VGIVVPVLPAALAGRKNVFGDLLEKLATAS